jgi:hypothetical protein
MDEVERRVAALSDPDAQPLASFEETRQASAFVQLLELGAQDIEAGRTRPARMVVDELRSRAAAE